MLTWGKGPFYILMFRMNVMKEKKRRSRPRLNLTFNRDRHIIMEFLHVSLWGILDFKFAPAKNTPPNPAIFSADFGSDMQNKLPGCIFFYVPWCPGSLGPPGHVFRKKLLCRQWKLQIHRDWVWLCMAADFLLIHEKSAAESGFLGCAAKPLAF